MKSIILTLILGIAPIGFAATYVGNGNSGFGGVLGTGSLTVTDNGSDVTFTFTKGSGSFNDYLVVYFDSPSVTSGSTILDTSGDIGGPFGGRRAVVNEFGSGISSFGSGFTASHAFALASNASQSNHLFSIADNSTNAGGLGFVNTYSVSNFGSTSATTYTWTIPFADLGLTPGVSANDTFQFVATYLNPFSGAGSDSSFRSDEAIGATGSGNPGFNDFAFTSSFTYTVTPEPSRLVLVLAGLVGAMGRRRRD